MTSNLTNNEDQSYLGEHLSVLPVIQLLDNTHPLTDKLVGKVTHFYYEDYILAAHFVDERNMSWWFGSGANKGTTLENPYAAFEIADNIYFVTWVEAATPAHNTPELHKGDWLVSIVLDLNKMVATDAYMNPDEEGRSVFHLAQARVTIEDKENAS